MNLRGKQAVITGGGRGIGKTIAEALAREGCRVLLVSRTISELEKTESEIKARGGDAEIVSIDVGETDAPEALKKAIGKAFPEGVDILAAAAGMYGPIGFVGDIDPAEWKKALLVNLFGVFAAVQAVVPGMQKRGRGKIIALSGGGDGALPNFSAYVSSKGGILRLVETLAAELQKFNIDVNAITPGPVNTKLVDDVLSAGPEKAGEEMYQKALRQKEEGGVSPEKAADLVLFLASPESDGISGKLFRALYDHYREYPSHKDEIMNSDIFSYRRIRPQDRGYDWQ